MAFVAVCPECNHSQVCVLKGRALLRMICSRCRSAFDADGSRSKPTTSDADRLAPAPDFAPPTPVAPAPAVAVLTVAPPVAASKKAPSLPLPDVAPAPAAEPADEESAPQLLVLLRKWMDPLGASGLGLCALALLTAAIGRLSILVPILAALAAVVGLAGSRSAYRGGRPLVMPATATAVGLVVFFLAVAVPSALGPGYEGARDRGPSESAVQVLPHARFLHDLDLSDSGWIDAAKASLQQGRVRVEVTDVWVESAATTSELCVRLRLQRTRSGQEIADGSFAAPLMWSDRVRATLIDSVGTRYQQKPPDPARARAAGPSSGATRTVDVSQELLVFDNPAASGSGFRLELPAAAWGGSGTLRFSIPASMVRAANPAPVRPKR